MLKAEEYHEDILGRYSCVTDAATYMLKQCFTVVSDRADDIQRVDNIHEVFERVVAQVVHAGRFIDLNGKVSLASSRG